MKINKMLFGIVIAFVFLASIGFTYAFFTVTSSVQGNANDILTSTGTLQLDYADADHNLVINNAYPGNTATKTFVVTNTGTLDAVYNIKWKTLANEITNDELSIELTCTTYSTYFGEGNANNVSNGSCGYTYDTIGYSTDGSVVSMVDIAVDEIQVYNVEATFRELNINQNYNQGKSFHGELIIGDGVNETNVTGYLYGS